MLQCTMYDKRREKGDVVLLYSRLQVDHYITDTIKFEFSDIILSLYTKKDSYRRRFVGVWIYFYIIIILL